MVKARSSVVEHYIDTVGVGSSILPAPTTFSPRKLNREMLEKFCSQSRDAELKKIPFVGVPGKTEAEEG